MYFCGDVAISGKYENIKYKFNFADNQRNIFLNLEGAICDNEEADTLLKQRKVFNTEYVIELMRLNKVTGCILANNHIADINDHGLTKQLLNVNKIKYTGFGKNEKEACEPLLFDENGIEYSLIAFGWYVTACKYSKKDRPGVNPMEIANVLKQISIEKKRGRKVIVFFHWNYIYELYPMPAQRELAKKAVDAGACLIIGCHPHCIEGIEFYKNVPIVYSLGNWIFDNEVYFNGKLNTKDIGLDELVAEYIDGELYCHWYRFDAVKSVPIHIGTEKASDSSRVSALTPYNGMDDDEYIKWFKKNKTVHILMPVFTRNKNVIRNKIYYIYVFTRGKIRKLIRCITGR